MPAAPSVTVVDRLLQRGAVLTGCGRERPPTDHVRLGVGARGRRLERRVPGDRQRRSARRPGASQGGPPSGRGQRRPAGESEPRSGGGPSAVPVLPRRRRPVVSTQAGPTGGTHVELPEARHDLRPVVARRCRRAAPSATRRRITAGTPSDPTGALRPAHGPRRAAHPTAIGRDVPRRRASTAGRGARRPDHARRPADVRAR